MQRTRGVHDISVKYISVNKAKINLLPSFISPQKCPQACSHGFFFAVCAHIAETTSSHDQLLLK